MTHPTDRTQRHLAICQELAELGMQLTRAAAAQALAAQADAKPDQAAKAATLFTRLSQAVRQAMTLENRIAAAHEAAVSRSPAQVRDHRRDYLREVFHIAAFNRPQWPDFKREAYEHLDEELAKDRSAGAQDLLATLSEKLGVVLTEADLPEGPFNELWPIIPPTTPRQNPEPKRIQ